MIETLAHGDMTTKVIASSGASRNDESTEEIARPWSREEAQNWKHRNPSVSPWWVVAVQALAGLVCGALTWTLTERAEVAWSALYGAAAIVLPGALLARGMTRRLGNTPAAAGQAMFQFMFWEMVKIGAAVAMLVAAPRMIQGLSWPAMLLTMIVCAKMNWWALLWQRRPRSTKTRV